jgi:hypothetical protein
MWRRTVLLIISVAFLIGGLGRLIANKGFFAIFQMEHLWSNQPFVIYNYKLLAVFVIWVGIILLICSRDLTRYRSIITGSIVGLGLFFVVSLVAGFATGLGLRYFLVDSVFSLILIVLLLIIRKKKAIPSQSQST